MKSVSIAPIVSTSAALAFWNTAGFPAMHQLMVGVWEPLPQAVWLVAVTVAVVALARLAMSLARRFGTSDRPQSPELAFLATSLLLFHPYLWIEDTNQATLGMLLGHFIQYLAIVWLVHRRKFGERPERGVQMSSPWLARLSTSSTLLLVVLFASGAVSLALRLVPVFNIQTLYWSRSWRSSWCISTSTGCSGRSGGRKSGEAWARDLMGGMRHTDVPVSAG